MQTTRIVGLLAVLASTAFAQKPLTVAVGSQRTLTFAALQRIAVGDAAIADVKTVGNELVVIGASAGHTTLLVWRAGVTAAERFDVTVTPPGSTATPAVAPPAESTPPPTFSPSLKLGMKTTRSAPDLQRVALGDPGVADLTIDGSTLTLVGVSPGQTNVLLWFADGHREQWLVTVVK